MTSSSLGLDMCDKCGCHEALHYLMFDDPDTRESLDFRLCRSCQRQMVQLIRRAQGLFEEE